MTFDGPSIHNLSSIESVGIPQRTGGDNFSVITNNISGGRDGDVYQCSASNGVSSDPTDSVQLRGTRIILWMHTDMVTAFLFLSSC